MPDTETRTSGTQEELEDVVHLSATLGTESGGRLLLLLRKLPCRPADLRLVVGTITDAAAIDTAVADADAVLSAPTGNSAGCPTSS